MRHPRDLALLVNQLHVTRGTRWREHRALLVRLLPVIAGGIPLSPARIAVTLGIDQSELPSRLEVLRRYGCEFTADGHLVGAILSQNPTPHHVQIAGRDLFAWCALDTLFLPALLQQPLTVQSRCPVTHQPISLSVTPAAVEHCYPAQAALSLVTQICERPGPQGDFCGHIFFFASVTIATTWVGTREGMAVLTVAEAFAVAQAVYVI